MLKDFSITCLEITGYGPKNSYEKGEVTYRYGFNGMEKDDENKGQGNSLDYGARIYDARLGRWLSLDPLAAEYPSMSPYNFVGNMPIIAKDPDGRDIEYRVSADKNGNKTVFVTVNAKMINLSSKKNSYGDMSAVKSFAEQNASKIFSQKFEDPGGKEVNVKFTLNITIIDDMDQIEKNDHVIGLVDDIDRAGNVSDPIGLATIDGNTTINESSSPFENLSRTINHELAHNLGLSDEYEVNKNGEMTKNNPNNLMGAGSGTGLNNGQLQLMFYRYVANGTSKTTVQRNSLGNEGDSRKESPDFIESNTR